jgi:hypothetical protein
MIYFVWTNKKKRIIDTLIFFKKSDIWSISFSLLDERKKKWVQQVLFLYINRDITHAINTLK